MNVQRTTSSFHGPNISRALDFQPGTYFELKGTALLSNVESSKTAVSVGWIAALLHETGVVILL